MSSPLVLLIQSTDLRQPAASWFSQLGGSFKLETVRSLAEAEERLHQLEDARELPPLVVVLAEGEDHPVLLKRLSGDGNALVPIRSDEANIDHQLALIAEASGRMLSSLDRDAILRFVQDLSCQLVQADAFAIWSHLEGASEWKIVSSSGLENPDQAAHATTPSLTGYYLEVVRPVEDPLGQPELADRHDFYRREGIRSLLFAPARLGQDERGTLVFYYRTPRTFTEAHVRLAGTLANLASSALVTASLYSAQETLRLKAEAARTELMESEERLRLALETGEMGIFSDDLASGRVTWNAAMARLHGVADMVFESGFERYLDRVHPQDRSRFSTVVAAARQTPEVAHRAEYRVVWPNGEIHWLDTRFRVLLGADKNPVEVCGVTLDVTQSKRTEMYHTVRHAVSEILSHSESIKVASPRLLRVVAITLGWDDASLWTLHPPNVGSWDPSQRWIMDDDGNVLQEAATWNLTSATQDRIIPSGLLKKVSTSARYVWQTDPSGTWFAFPLSLARHVLGVFVLGTRHPWPANESMVDLGSNLGSIIGQFVARQATEQQLVEEGRVVETLHQVGTRLAAVLDQDELLHKVLAEGTQSLGARWAALAYRNEPLRVFGSPPPALAELFPASPVFDSVWQTESPPLIFDVPPGGDRAAPRSYLAVGIPSARGEIVGAICFAQPDPESFTSRHERMAMGLAAWAGMALDNAGSYQAVQDAEQRARVQLGFTRSVTASLEEGVLATDVSQRCTFVNPAMAGLLGRTEADILGQQVGGFFPGEIVPALVQSTLDSRVAGHDELSFRRADGAQVLLACTVSPFVDRDRLIGAVVSVEDITVRKQVEAEREQALAHEKYLVETLAQSFLGKVPPIEGVEVAALYNAAKRADHVGGDYFDFIKMEDHRLGIIVGDVCGKGVEAAVYTAMAKYMLRGFALENPEPGPVLTRLNQALYNEMSDRGMFVTILYGILDFEARTLTYVNAGHPAPILYNPEGSVCTFLEPTAGLVGGMADMPFSQATVTIPPRALLALYTDGVTEADGSLDRDDVGLCAVIRQAAAGTVKEVTQAIFDYALECAGGNLRDDVAIVVIREEHAAGASQR